MSSTMGSWSRRSIACAVAMIAISSCSSSDETETSIASQPVDSVRSNPANGAAVTFGEPADVGDMKVTASDPVVETDESGPWLTVTIRAENRSAGDVQTPQFELRCSGSSAGGSWLGISTFIQGAPVPSGSFSEGTISLVVPGDERLGEPRPSCAAPATVVASLLTFDNTGAGAPVQKRVGWTVPEELVDELNAAPRPT
jgi:hypothetical protein